MNQLETGTLPEFSSQTLNLGTFTTSSSKDNEDSSLDKRIHATVIPMEPIIRSDIENQLEFNLEDCLIKYLVAKELKSHEGEEVSKEEIPQKEVLQKSAKKKLKALKKASFMSNEIKLLKLFYLTHVQEKEKAKNSPFEKKDVQAFEKVNELTKVLFRWHKYAWLPFALGSLSGYASGISLVGADDASSVFVPATLALISGIAVNYFSKWLTGTLPNDLSDAQNEKQNTVGRIKDCYDDLGYELIHLFFNQSSSKRAMAKEFASRIDPQRIRSHLNDLDSNQINRTLQIFDAAIYYINHEKKPSAPRHFWDHIKSKKRKFDKRLQMQ